MHKNLHISTLNKRSMFGLKFGTKFGIFFFILFLYLGLYVLGNDKSISKGSFIRTKTSICLGPHQK